MHTALRSFKWLSILNTLGMRLLAGFEDGFNLCCQQEHSHYGTATDEHRLFSSKAYIEFYNRWYNTSSDVYFQCVAKSSTTISPTLALWTDTVPYPIPFGCSCFIQQFSSCGRHSGSEFIRRFPY